MKNNEVATNAQGRMRVVLPDIFIDEYYVITDDTTPLNIFKELSKENTYVEITSDFDGVHLELVYIKR